jgi:hypothetical protein
MSIMFTAWGSSGLDGTGVKGDTLIRFMFAMLSRWDMALLLLAI